MARTKFTELARLSNSFRSRNLGKSRLGDCLDAADRQGEGVFASTSGVEDEEFRDEPFDDQDSPEPSTGRKRMRTQKALAALESDFLLPSWLTGNKADLSQAFQRSQFPNDMFSIPSKYLRKKKLKVDLSKMQNGKKSSMKERRELKQPNRALQQAIKEIPQTMALALADLLSTACFNR